jgi:Zn-dependent protease with chaperone function
VQGPGGYRHRHVERFRVMIGLSVAIGRFVEALFWAIARVAGVVSIAAIAAAAVLGGAFLLVRALWRRRRG